LSFLFGVTLGALSAHGVPAPGSTVLITVVALVFYATPLYWLALMAVLVFTVQLDMAAGLRLQHGGFGCHRPWALA
jgi:peptide/nickel transport system permease protein